MVLNVNGEALLLLEYFVQFASLQPERLAAALWHDPDAFVRRLRCLDEAMYAAIAEPVRKKGGKSDKCQPPLPDDFDFRFSGPIGGKIKEFLAYKTERKDYYSPTGLRNLLTQIDNRVKEPSAEQVIELIADCMANNWKGIIWERIGRQEDHSYGRGRGRSSGKNSSNKSPWADFICSSPSSGKQTRLFPDTYEL